MKIFNFKIPKSIRRIIFVTISATLGMIFISWVLNRTSIYTIFHIDNGFITDYLSAIVLIVTAYIILDYTKATKLLVKTNNELVQSSMLQTKLIKEQSEFGLLPSLKHELYMNTIHYDDFDIRLKLYNHCSFEIYVKVFVDISINGVMIEFPKLDERLAYKGERLWPVEAYSNYEGHFRFGIWFMEGYKSWEDFYELDFNSELLEDLKFSQYYSLYKDKEVKIKVRFRSISAFEVPYFSNAYTYTFLYNISYDPVLLVPQVTNLEVDDIYCKGKKKPEYIFPDLPNCEPD